MKKILLAALAAAVLVPGTASASLIYDSSIVLGAQGFGSAPRDLTVQRTGRVTSPESGCVSAAGGVFSGGAGACLGADAAFGGNGFINTGGHEVNPLADNQKFGIPLASALGIDGADDIGILFNATEPAGNAVDVLDLTLKFYSAGVYVGSIDGSQSFLDSNPGNGVAGFVFKVDDAQLAYVNGLLGLGAIQFAIEATLGDTSGGPESFLIFNLNAPPPVVPEPTSLVLLGLGMLGAGVARRSRN